MPKHEIPLAGCTPTPLAHYLKALGVLRLVAEQADPTAQGQWRGEHFVLHSRLDQAGLKRFFLEDYAPTPILSPWNGRAGYLEGEDGEDSTRRGPELLRLFRNSTVPRLEQYRSLIATLDNFSLLNEMNLVRARKKALDKAKKASPKTWTEEKQAELLEATKRDGQLKREQLQILRNELPDEQLSWLDAAVAIGENHAFAPLLGGSGGVEGSMDLGVNFMNNVLLLITTQTTTEEKMTESPHWLEHALFGTTIPLAADNSSCSLAPGQIGGHNATSGFSRYLSINPWDFVLMLEGALAFKPSLTRKLESTTQARLSYPFTVVPTAVGAGAIAALDEGNARAGSSELWMPLWNGRASYAELSILLREGQARLGTTTPKDGLDMARAVSQLGMDRGIAGFQRYLFLKRSGKNDLAVPLSRINVNRTRPNHANSNLITDFDRYHFLAVLREFARGKEAPASLIRAVAQLENALFALTQPGAGRAALQRGLILLGEVMQTLADSRKGREKLTMLPRLSSAWVIEANDNSPEFRIALALAGLPEIRANLAPVARDKGRWQWQPDSRSYVWSKGDLARNLIRVAERRGIEARRDAKFQAFGNYPHLGARLADLHAFLANETDDAHIAALLQGLIWADLPEALLPSPASGGGVGGEGGSNIPHLPLAYALCKPFFTPAATLRAIQRLPEDNHLAPPEELPRLLAASQVDKAVALAWQRGHIAGLAWPAGQAPQAGYPDGPRLLAALLIPLQTSALAKLLPEVKASQPETV